MSVRKVIFHAIVCIVLFYFRDLLAALPIHLIYTVLKIESSIIFTVIGYLCKIVVPILFVYFYIKKILKMPLSDFCIKKPKSILTCMLYAIILPFVVIIFYIIFVPGDFTITEISTHDIITVIGVGAKILATGILVELILRGLMVNILGMKFNKIVSVGIPSILFVGYHIPMLLLIPSMESSSLLSIILMLISATTAGIMVALIMYINDSVWASVAAYGIWNLMIVSGIFQIGSNPQAIINYKINSDSILLTGGTYGINSSLPTIIAYCIVIVIILLQQRRKKKIPCTDS